MRTTKELLQLMLDNQQYFFTCLCNWNSILFTMDIISYQEYIQLQNYINRNRPSIFSSWYAFKHRNKSYYWEKGDIAPRIKWIKQHIKLLNK